MACGWRSLVVLLGAAALAAAAIAVGPPEKEKLAELQARFDKETNAVHKAKLLTRLSAAQFDETRRLEKLGDFSSVGLLWEKFRDNAKITLDGLKKQVRDAEKHVGGYRELEIGLREGIREIDQTMLLAPPEYHPPLQIVRDDLSTMDDEVLRLLFPRRTMDVPAAPSTEKQP